MTTARDGVQTLVASLFSLPITSSEDGPVAQLPPPTTQLPRAKPLPKPKPLTKWEQFAKAKGIQHSKKDKKAWDEERQEWVERWGWKGANKKEETQWLTEVPANAGTFAIHSLLTDVYHNCLAFGRRGFQPFTRGEKGPQRTNGEERTSATTEPCAGSARRTIFEYTSCSEHSA